VNIRKVCGDLYELSIDSTPRPREWRRDRGRTPDEATPTPPQFARKKSGIVRFILRGGQVWVLRGNVMLSSKEILGMAKLAGLAT
jgi:hypothetical protein